MLRRRSLRFIGKNCAKQQHNIGPIAPNGDHIHAVVDAISPSKSHRNVIPLLWDLIEPHIKYKPQLLLPW